MSASSEWTEWHLTASGWVRGTTKTETAKKIAAPPQSSVAAYQYIEEHSGYGGGTERVVQTSTSSKVSADEMQRLLDLFGNCPQSL